MFFYLAKAVWFFLQPSAFVIFLILAGLLLKKTRFQRWGRRFIVIGIVGFLAIAFSPLGRQLMIPLEDRFPQIKAENPIAEAAQPDGIIVLGGTIHMRVSDQRGVPSIVSGAERIFEAVKIARKYPSARIILVGGPNTVGDNPTADSTVVKKMMIDLGIEPARLETETRSRNTWQNAEMAKQLAKPKKGETWWLITSAYHMPRAIGCFRAAAWPVTAYPVDYFTGGETSRFAPFYYALDGVTITDTAAKEWLGLLVYKATGRSSALFPGP